MTALQSGAGTADIDVTDVQTLLVSQAPPSATQSKVAWGTVIFLCIAFAIAVPFYDIDLPVVPPFVPVVHAVVCITGLIAAAFLFSQYTIQRHPAFLALAGGYLSAGLFAFLQSLAFPNAYSAAGLFGGPSAAAWLFVMWRTSFPLGVLAYILMPRLGARQFNDRSAAVPIALTVICVVIGTCCLTWIMLIAQQHLPPLFTDATHEAAHVHVVTIPAIALSLAAILLLLTKRRTTLDLWLIVTLITALPDIVVPVPRFALGFYLARSYELISSCAVLSALLTEASTLYARLASAKTFQAHAEAERLRSAEAATAAIAHELRQPLTAIKINANAGVGLLRSQDPALSDVVEILDDIDKDASRANDMIDRVRALVRRQKPYLTDLDINAVVSEVVKLLSTEAETRRVEIDTGLSSERPYLGGDRTQIIEVLLNLAMNGMHAMEAVPAERRRLTFQTAKRDGEVVIAVRDRGCGISKQTMPRLFEPFFTTRSEGMGLGLSIAESIVQSHQGRVWAENNADYGATIYVSFPARPHEAGAPPKSAVLPAV